VPDDPTTPDIPTAPNDTTRPDDSDGHDDSPVIAAEHWLDNRLNRSGLRPRDAAFLIAGFWAIAVVVFGVVERLVDHKTFHTVWLGIWWAIETVTTVGYGDVVPDQVLGKVIAGLLMLGGLSLLSVVTAAITSGFVSRAEARRRSSGHDPVVLKLEEITRELRAIRERLDRADRDQR
jgi:voltage-gated potassium channel